MNKKLLFLPIFSLIASGCFLISKKEVSHKNEFDYGVFLGIDREDIDKITKYETVVIDAQYFEKEDIKYLHDNKQTVYSYFNVGSLENFRPYYNEYKEFALGEYENWEEEVWMDVSNNTWRYFLEHTLAPEILDKGVDGLFIDNLDVYYEYHTEAIYEGVKSILNYLYIQDTYLIINGGDAFVTEYIKERDGRTLAFHAVNQETIFSKINWEDETFGVNDKEEREYFQEYVETVASCKKDIYLLEYTKDEKLIKEIEDYCYEKGFKYYISSSLELII